METTIQNRYGASRATDASVINDAHSSAGEKRVLRWGGIAGMLGGVLFLAVFLFVGAVIGPDPAGPEGPISRFPEIRAARTIENALYLAVLMLWTAHVVALYRALRVASPAPAIIGSALSIMGLVVLAAGALPHAATVSIADLYHAPGASAQDRAELVMAWQATQAIFNALLVTGLVLLPFGVASFGIAMRETSAFGTRYGWAGVSLGVIGVGVAVALLVDPQSFIAVVGFLSLIVFHLVVGWKVRRMSRV
jgi:hypothetical protein